MLEIIFLYSEDICPFKSSFWSDIWQIGPDIIYWLTTPWRRELKMCWWHVRSSCPIIMWNWPDIIKIWSDNVWWPTVISSTDKDKKFSSSLYLHLCLSSLASCENETQHKHKEICYVWPIKALVPDSTRLSIWTKWRMPWLLFNAYAGVRFH